MGLMRPRIVISALLALWLLASGSVQAQDDAVLRAMREELERSMKQLQLENLEKPYFISYRVQEKNSADVTASFGAVVASSTARLRFLSVEVRVGSPKLDNTNFFSMSFLNRGGLAGGFGGVVQLPLEDNVRELRRQLWLATDTAYKKALEDLSRKQAALQNKTTTEELSDFTQQQPATLMEAPTAATLDVARLESVARNLSAVYKGSTDIYTDSAHVTADQTYTRYVNSEGTTFTRENPTVAVVLTAATQAADGAPLRDFLAIYGRSIDDLPSMADLEMRAQDMGKRLEGLRNAGLVDQYSGPVLFEGQAAAELFGEVMAPALLAIRRPASDMPQFEMFSSQMGNTFQDRLGGRVLPDFLSVADDATLREYEKVPLAGSNRIDDDGVPTRHTVLVENGILKALLATRNPVRGISQSTGNRRGGGVSPTNLFVTVRGGLSDQEMKAKLQSLITQRGLPFGITVRRLANPLIGDPLDMMSAMMGGVMPGLAGGAPAVTALVVYKVYQDGHEELVRNVTLEGVSAASFKEVVSASANSTVYTIPFLSIRHSVFNVLGGGAWAEAAPPMVSMVVPSLLFEDVTLKQPVQENPKLPLSPRPVAK